MNLERATDLLHVRNSSVGAKNDSKLEVQDLIKNIWKLTEDTDITGLESLPYILNELMDMASESKSAQIDTITSSDRQLLADGGRINIPSIINLILNYISDDQVYALRQKLGHLPYHLDTQISFDIEDLYSDRVTGGGIAQGMAYTRFKVAYIDTIPDTIDDYLEVKLHMPPMAMIKTDFRLAWTSFSAKVSRRYLKTSSRRRFWGRRYTHHS